MDAAGPLAQIGQLGATALKASSLWKSGQAAKESGEAIARARTFEAAQLTQRAGQERAGSQRRMLVQRKNEKLVQSALQARSAAQGGAGDPSVVDLAGDIAAEGQYRALTALYEGESLARSLEMGASLKHYEAAEARRAGEIQKRARRMDAFTTLLGGGAQGLDFFSKYNPGASQVASPWIDPGIEPGWRSYELGI